MSKFAPIFLILALIFTIFISLLLGKYDFEFTRYIELAKAIFNGNLAEHELIYTLIFEVRLPRILACVVIGASLAISGASYQAMFVNPLVSPSILGVLSGAGFGAALAMYFRLELFFIQLSTFLFGFLAALISVAIAGIYEHGRGVILLVLGGVISSSLFTALLSVLKYAADPNDTLPNITYFLMGSLSFASKNLIYFSLLPMILGVILLIFCSKFLDALSLGEEEAKSLGVNVFSVKIFIILVTTFISALSVSIAGLIGWIGLIVPHITRFLLGANNRVVLPCSALLGAIFLLLCDDFSRTAFSYEIPIGIVTSLFGIPIFIAVLLRVKGAR